MQPCLAVTVIAVVAVLLLVAGVIVAVFRAVDRQVGPGRLHLIHADPDLRCLRGEARAVSGTRQSTPRGARARGSGDLACRDRGWLGGYRLRLLVSRKT